MSGGGDASILHQALRNGAATLEPDKVFFNPDFLCEFIRKYRSLPGVWRAKSREYLNAASRQAAWDELVEFCRARGIPRADVAWVKRKVHTIRGSFNKECKKVRASLCEGAGEAYRPKLWYYDQLLFLRGEGLHDSDDEGSRASYEPPSSGPDSEPEGQGRADPDLESYMHYYRKGLRRSRVPHKVDRQQASLNGSSQRAGLKTNSISSVPSSRLNAERAGSTDETGLDGPSGSGKWTKRSHEHRKKAEPDLDDLRKTVLKRAASVLDRPEDEFDALGTALAAKLRAIAARDYTQFMMADKLVNEVLYKGYQMQLTDSTGLYDPDEPELIVPDSLHVDSGRG